MFDPSKIKFDYDTMKIKICRGCKGLGNIKNRYGAWITCPICQGQGRIVTKTNGPQFRIAQIDFSNSGQQEKEAEKEATPNDGYKVINRTGDDEQK